MTTPDVRHAFEIEVEVPGTPEQVWDAIATAHGISAWMMSTELDGRVGGEVVFHMGPEMESKGKVTVWDPPRRIAYEEYWDELVGQGGADVTPLVSEFVVEARSGGTCVVRVVSSAFGTGADWEQEFFDGMDKGWRPMFVNLRLYLTHFPGQKATPLEVSVDAAGSPSQAVAAVRGSAGIDEVGQVIGVRDAKGIVERVDDESVLVRLTDPVPGMLGIFAFDNDGTKVNLLGYLFADDAPAYVERERAGWESWLSAAAETSTSAGAPS